jgi:thiamine-phosphate pyrophosphorylase
VKPISDCRLYTFVDTAYLRGRAPAGLAEQICRGGADVIQLRAKDCSPEQVRRLTLELLPVTRQAGVNLIVNDHLSVAVETGADGCHLGQEDFFQAGHERIADLKPASRPFIIGLSTHAPDQARRSLAAGPDYIAIGPVYATGTKPTARPVTLEYVRWAAARLTLPWFAIGGIQLKNLDEVLAAGATRVCVVSAILNAPDVAEACQAFKERLPSASRP